MKPLKKSKFTENFLKANGLTGNDFRGWLICDGMLFNSTETWWGSREKRERSHEGLDLGFYGNGKNRVVGLNEATKIPVMYDGVVVGIFDDLLGKSLFVRHGISNIESRYLCTIFGHTNPDSNIYPGKRVKEGETVVRVAHAEKSEVSPHLHITIGWVQEEISDDLLDWKAIGNPGTFKLIDPLEVIDRYSIVSTSVLFPGETLGTSFTFKVLK